MIISKIATAGTLESSDVRIVVEPCENGIEIELHSAVSKQYSKQIRRTIMETLSRLHVANVKMMVNDSGALDCTIKARVECAVHRASDDKVSDKIDWKVL